MIQRLFAWFGYQPIVYGGPKFVVIRPGDVLVLKSAAPMSSETCERLKQELGKRFDGYDVLVLSGGLDIEVIRKVA
jgi:hypothetical protein